MKDEVIVEVKELENKIQKLVRDREWQAIQEIKESPEFTQETLDVFDGFLVAVRKMSWILPVDVSKVEKWTFESFLNVHKFAETCDDKWDEKQTICNLLCQTLQRTRMYCDLQYLKYEERDDGREIVTARFDHAEKVANVSGDSGIGMIEDIMRAIR